MGDAILFKHSSTRKSRYVDAMQQLKSGFAHIHHIDRMNNATDKDKLNALTMVCSNLASGMSIVTNTVCSVCIKYLAINTQGEITLNTLVRDNGNLTSRQSPDKLNHTHLLAENSDFENIYKNQQTTGIFISNKLPFINNYKNSSFQTYGEPVTIKSGYKYPLSLLFRYIRWPLPYCSTICVPIIPAKYDANLDNELIGFLCVDSAKLGVFDIKTDKDFLIGVSDGIYNTLESII